MKIINYILIGLIALLFSGCNDTNTSLAKNKREITREKDSTNQFIFSTDQRLKLKRITKQAKHSGVVITHPRDEVRGKWILNQDTTKVEIKVISDYNSVKNPTGNSFRVKLKSGNIAGSRVINLYPAETVKFEKLLFLHTLCKKMGILSPRVGRISTRILDAEPREYVWIEHFEKQLLESQNCREAPILKFDAIPYKELLAKENKNKLNYNVALLSKVTILPFGRKKTFSDTTLRDQYRNGQTILEQLRAGDYKKLSSLVDLEKFALWHLLKDASLGENSPIPWYNLRFYYNPTNAKIEPIVYAFDVPATDSRIIEESLKFESKIKGNAEFQTEYKKAQSLLEPNFIKSIITKTNSLIAARGWSGDSLSKENLLKNLQIKTKTIRDTVNYKVTLHEPLPSLGIRVMNKGDQAIEVTNLHNASIELIGAGLESGIVSKINQVIPSNSTITLQINYPIIYYRVQHRESIYRQNFRLPASLPKSIGQTIRAQAKIPEGFMQRGDTIYYVGNHKIYTTDVIIPPGYSVFFPKGSAMELKSCGFLSFSPVFAKGTKTDPILFYSNHATGFTVIDADIRSEFSYASFEKFGNQNYDGWTLPGAVTFNHSDVQLLHCNFANNSCEDALNIVSSHFLLDGCSFKSTYGDAFDADFCTGEVKNTKFAQVGNDAIDFSGSSITIDACDIKQCGDKGISAGENSSLKISGVSISEAVIGIASKDQSEVIANTISLDHCNRNFAVFQKKKEYGPAKIEIQGGEITPGKLKNILGKGSVFIRDGNKTIGKESIDITILY